MLRRIISLFLSLTFIFQQTLPAGRQAAFAQAAAVELNLASHLARLSSSIIQPDTFRPLHLRFFSYDTFNNNFNLLLDKGDLKPEELNAPNALNAQTKELLNYFLIGLTLPNDAFWVNLRPDSPDNVIDDQLARTDIGRILLEADLQLKKDTSAATSPQTPEGKVYWDKLYKKASELYGLDNVTIPTLTRPWIVPGEIIVRETAGSPVSALTRSPVKETNPPSAYIYKATLKVMLEADYLKEKPQGAVIANPSASVIASPGRGEAIQKPEPSSFSDSRAKALNEYSTQLIRELIIPKLTKEVNTSKRYASLRQVYYSLILAQWFKARHKQGLFNTSVIASHPASVIANPPQAGEAITNLIDKQDLTNLTSKQAWDKDTYFQAYKKSFTEGEYNLKEPHYTPTGQVIRSYMSGGVMAQNLAPTFSSVGSPVGKKPYLVPMFVEFGKGTTFTITLPAAASPSTASTKSERPRAGSPVADSALEKEPIGVYPERSRSASPLASGGNNLQNPDIRALAEHEKQMREENLAKARRLLRKENLQNADTITIFGFNNGKWGDDIVQTSMLITYLLIAAPHLKIKVIWNRPELAALFGGKVESIYLMDYLGSQEKFINQFNRKTDIVIELAGGLGRRYPDERKLERFYNMFVGTRNRYERWHRLAKEVVGIEETSDVIFKRKSQVPGVILVNPHAVTQKSVVGNKAWIDMIRKLLSDGYKPVLSEGVTPADEYRTEKIIDELGPEGHIETIRKTKEDFISYLSSNIDAVITADTAVFHLAYRFGIPAVVITNSDANGWIPELQNNFRSLIADQLDNTGIVKALEELGVKNKRLGSVPADSSVSSLEFPVTGQEETKGRRPGTGGPGHNSSSPLGVQGLKTGIESFRKFLSIPRDETEALFLKEREIERQGHKVIGGPGFFNRRIYESLKDLIGIGIIGRKRLVYSPVWDGRLSLEFAEHAKIDTRRIAKRLIKQGKDRMRILVIGSGTGLDAMTAVYQAKVQGLYVTLDAIDIQQEAVENSEFNFELLLKDKLTELDLINIKKVKEGEEFASLVHQKYDLVLFNAPDAVTVNQITESTHKAIKMDSDIFRKIMIGIKDRLFDSGVALVSNTLGSIQYIPVELEIVGRMGTQELRKTFRLVKKDAYFKSLKEYLSIKNAADTGLTDTHRGETKTIPIQGTLRRDGSGASPLTPEEQTELNSLIEDKIIDPVIFIEGSLEYKGLIQLMRNTWNLFYGIGNLDAVRQWHRHKYLRSKGDFLQDACRMLGWIKEAIGERAVETLFPNLILNNMLVSPSHLIMASLLDYPWDQESMEYVINLVSKGKEYGKKFWLQLIFRNQDENYMRQKGINLDKQKRGEVFIKTLRNLSSQGKELGVFDLRGIILQEMKEQTVSLLEQKVSDFFEVQLMDHGGIHARSMMLIAHSMRKIIEFFYPNNEGEIRLSLKDFPKKEVVLSSDIGLTMERLAKLNSMAITKTGAAFISNPFFKISIYDTDRYRLEKCKEIIKDVFQHSGEVLKASDVKLSWLDDFIVGWLTGRIKQIINDNTGSSPLKDDTSSSAADSADITHNTLDVTQQKGASPLALDGKDLLALVYRIEPVMEKGGFGPVSGTQIERVYKAFDEEGNKLPFVIKIPRKDMLRNFAMLILPFAKSYMGGIIAPFTVIEGKDAVLLGKEYLILILQRELSVFRRRIELPEKYTMPSGTEVNLQEKKRKLLLELVKKGISYQDIIGGNEQYGLDLETGELYFFDFSFPKYKEKEDLFHGYLSSIRYELGWSYKEAEYLEGLWATERDMCYPTPDVTYEQQSVASSPAAADPSGITHGTLHVTQQKGSSPLGVDDKIGRCVTADTLLPIVSREENVTFKHIVEVKFGDQVLSLNEETGQIEPHRIKGLLDMGVKPVYKLTTASGRSIKTTANHPYLTEKGWVKVGELKVGDEIAVPKEKSFSAIGVFAGINSVNNNAVGLDIKTDTVFSNSESMGSRRKVNQWLGKRERVSAGDVQPDFADDAFLKLKRKLFKIPFSGRSEFKFFEHGALQDNSNACFILWKGTKPSFLASSMPFLSRSANFGLTGRCSSIASISQPTGLWNTYSLGEADSSILASTVHKRSHNEYVSNTKYFGEPFLSVTTAALKSLGEESPDFLSSSLETAANFSNNSTLTWPFTDNLFNDFDFILLSPHFCLPSILYHGLNFMSRLFTPKVTYAQPALDNVILWDKIASIEPLEPEHVYDIEVEGTHNFIGNGIFAHNTYIGSPAAGSALEEGSMGVYPERSRGASPLEGRDLLNLVASAKRISRGEQFIVYQVFDKEGKELPFVVKIPADEIIDDYDLEAFLEQYQEIKMNMGGVFSPFIILHGNDLIFMGEKYPCLIIQQKVHVIFRAYKIPDKYQLDDGTEIDLKEKKRQLLLTLVKKGIYYYELPRQEYGLDLTTLDLHLVDFAYSRLLSWDEIKAKGFYKDNILEYFLDEDFKELSKSFELEDIWGTERSKRYAVPDVIYNQEAVSSSPAADSEVNPRTREPANPRTNKGASPLVRQASAKKVHDIRIQRVKNFFDNFKNSKKRYYIPFDSTGEADDAIVKFKESFMTKVRLDITEQFKPLLSNPNLFIYSILCDLVFNSYDAVISYYDRKLPVYNERPFMYQGEVGVSVRKIIDKDKQRKLIISITDNGAGEKAADNAHKKEYRSQKKDKSPYIGWLGLGWKQAKEDASKLHLELTLEPSFCQFIIPEDSLIMNLKMAKGGFVEQESGSVASPLGGIDGSTEFSSDSRQDELGGIDMRNLAQQTRVEENEIASASAAPRNDGMAVAPRNDNSQVSSFPLVPVSINKELQEIQRLISAGIIPATERLEECWRSGCKNGASSSISDELRDCLADIFRLEEMRCESTKNNLKELLVKLESNPN